MSKDILTITELAEVLGEEKYKKLIKHIRKTRRISKIVPIWIILEWTNYEK